MASQTLTSVADVWPAGTSVGAYRRADWPQASLPPSGAPPGSAVGTATVASDGSLAFTGLADSTTYFAGAQAAGVWRYRGFSTPQLSAGSGSVSADSQTGSSDDAKMQAAINAAAAAVAASGGPVVISLSGRRYDWTGSVPQIPPNLAGKIIIEGNGSTVRLSSAAPQFLTFQKVADGDVFRNVSIRDLDVDCNNVAGFGHVIIGTGVYSASSLDTPYNVSIDRVSVRRVRAYNIPTDWTGNDLRTGVYLAVGLHGTAGETATSVTNIVCEDVRVEGGRFGVHAGSRFTTSGNVYVDNIHFNRCYHDTGATPTGFLGCTNFFVGSRGYGGKCWITNCIGRNSGDDGVEVNGMELALTTGTIIEDCVGAAFLHINFALPKALKRQRVIFRDCHAAVVNMVTSATMPGRGFVSNTVTIATTTSADVATSATTIPLTSVAPAAGYFPTSGVIYASGQTITYTGISGNTLTGVSGVTAGFLSGTTVTLVNDVYSFTLDGCSHHKTGQPYWEFLGDAFKVAGPIRHLTIRDFDYVCDNMAAVVTSAAVPSPFYINCQPTEGSDTQVRLDNIRIRLSGSRTGAGTADWIGVDISGYAPHVVITGLLIDQAMTGMSVVTDIVGVRFGRAVNAVGAIVATIKGMKIKNLGDVGSKQKGIRTGTQTQVGNSPLFDFSGLDFTGLLTGAVDVGSDSGSAVQTRTFVESILTKSAGRATSTTITVTTGTFQWQNTTQRRGVVAVSGGTVSAISIGPTNSALVSAGAATSGVYFLNPGDYIQVANTVIPTMTFVPFQ